MSYFFFSNKFECVYSGSLAQWTQAPIYFRNIIRPIELLGSPQISRFLPGNLEDESYSVEFPMVVSDSVLSFLVLTHGDITHGRSDYNQGNLKLQSCYSFGEEDIIWYIYKTGLPPWHEVISPWSHSLTWLTALFCFCSNSLFSKFSLKGGSLFQISRFLRIGYGPATPYHLHFNVKDQTDSIVYEGLTSEA